MSKDKDNQTDANPTEEVGNDLVIDATKTKNEIALQGKFAECHHPISDATKTALKEAKKNLSRANASDSAQAIKHWKAQVKELNKVELLDSVIEVCLVNIAKRCDTIVATGKFSPKDGQPTFHKLIGRDGKLGSRIEDVEYDGALLSEVIELAVESRGIAWRASKEAQAVMRTFGGNEGTIYQDVPERESIEIEPNGKINMEMKVTLKAHDIKGQLKQGIASGKIAQDAVDVLPLTHS